MPSAPKIPFASTSSNVPIPNTKSNKTPLFMFSNDNVSLPSPPMTVCPSALKLFSPDET
jgi:hypothetical protein